MNILLIWPSWSGKTSIQEYLIKNYWFTKPLNATSRSPRSENAYDVDVNWDFKNSEMDTYLFLTKDQFERKMRNWDFAEFNMYNWDYYGTLNQIDYTKNNVIVIDPVWAESLIKKFLLDWVDYKTFFIDITEEVQEHRLWFKRRESISTINERKLDFKYFDKDRYDVVLDWEDEIELNALKILKEINFKINLYNIW